MARTKQISLKESYLSEMIPGYRGYSPSDAAHKTDQVFAEEVLVDSLNACLSDAKTINAAALDEIENGRVEEIIDLDSEILDKLGNINQALSMLDLEGGVGMTPDELEAVVELLDDLGDSLRQRVILLEG